ncbi:MAG: YidC/Oxa1 family membrane protein insertase [Anaerolineae bacterium]
MAEIWNLLIFDPMVNLLILLYSVLGNNFVLAIVGLTVVIRLLSHPLTARQYRSLRAQQELQPRIQALQKKYAGKREKLTQETMKLYQERGVNPLSGCLPLIIQMPVWIGLYQAILQVLGGTPEQLINLSQHVYTPLATTVQESLPFQSRFLWLDLIQPDPFLILPVLVVITFWFQQRLTSMPSPDPQQASMARSMQIMMPLMFGWFTLSVPSGLAVYWFVSGIVGVVTQLTATGDWDKIPQRLLGRSPSAPAQPADPPSAEQIEASVSDGGKASRRRRRRRKKKKR